MTATAHTALFYWPYKHDKTVARRARAGKGELSNCGAYTTKKLAKADRVLLRIRERLGWIKTSG